MAEMRKKVYGSRAFFDRHVRLADHEAAYTLEGGKLRRVPEMVEMLRQQHLFPASRASSVADSKLAISKLRAPTIRIALLDNSRVVIYCAKRHLFFRYSRCKAGTAVFKEMEYLL